MATARSKIAPAGASATQSEAMASLRELRDQIVHVTVSDPVHQRTVVEFELPSDALVSAMDRYLHPQSETVSPEPNARVAAALDEAKRMTPRFKSAQELFDALEKEGQG